jgi:hypothetical protein
MQSQEPLVGQLPDLVGGCVTKRLQGLPGLDTSGPFMARRMVRNSESGRATWPQLSNINSRMW